MTTWTGWLRTPGQDWRQVCQALSWEGCWIRLLAVDPASDHAEKLVNRGQHPEQRRRPR